MEAETLIVTVAAGIARMRLNRPHKKNAITQEMWRRLAAELGTLSADPDIRAVVLCGGGADFSAGADIGEFATLRDADNAREYEAANSAAFAAVRTCRVPVIAAIRGICFGGGFGLAAAADIRLAAHGAQFCVPAAKLGLAYPQDAMQDIVFSAGPQMARYLAFTGARIYADEALAAGFLLEVVADGQLDARAAQIASAIAANAPLSVHASKLAIRSVLSGEAADADAAREAGAATFRSADYAEGRAAFAARRAPEFSGR
ncbi:enoyl-CoA hydratase [Aquamicrobium terrae]